MVSITRRQLESSRAMNVNKWIRTNIEKKWPRWLPRITKNRDGTAPDLANVKPEDLEKSLLKNLECPVCMEYMTPPINLCNNGHNICCNCRPNLDTCPTCRHQILQARNYALEDLCYKLNYPCKFHEEGCEEMFSGEFIKEHQAVCHHGTHICPLDRDPEIDCDWSGEYKALIIHLESQHEDLICSDTKFSSPDTNNTTFVLLIYNEIFFFHKCFREGRCYCVVQLFGTNSQASNFKYKIKLTAGNNIEKMSQIHLVRSITEEFDTIFRDGNCVRLDDEVIGHYIVDGMMKLHAEVTHTKVEEIEEPAPCKVKRSGFHPIFSDRNYWPWCLRR